MELNVKGLNMRIGKNDYSKKILCSGLTEQWETAPYVSLMETEND